MICNDNPKAPISDVNASNISQKHLLHFILQGFGHLCRSGVGVEALLLLQLGDLLLRLGRDCAMEKHRETGRNTEDGKE